ncbi:hypothetical protein SAMN03097705_0035 [[Enterobacter] aerogenes]|nr:hypothetical protein SAMN03097705_0035 [[Enterobacter] aerogenes] [Klebsiella aerogenes]
MLSGFQAFRLSGFQAFRLSGSSPALHHIGQHTHNCEKHVDLILKKQPTFSDLIYGPVYSGIILHRCRGPTNLHLSQSITFVAAGPFSPLCMANSTFCPSNKVLKFSPWSAEKWTKTSLLPSRGEMKPKPLSSLNHFTKPLILVDILTPVIHDSINSKRIVLKV